MTGSKPAIRYESTPPQAGRISLLSHHNGVPSAMNNRALRVAFLTPAWPIDVAANGIVTYVDTIATGLRAQGQTICILSAYTASASSERDLYPVERGQVSALERIRDGLAVRINRSAALRERFCRALVKTTRRAIAERGVQLLEMEESFGWIQQIKPHLPIPVVVRLHGPHFANGPVLRVATDAAFHRRVRDEGVGIAMADGVSSPSRDILEQTKAFYGLPLTDAAVIPYPGPAVPPERGWSLAECDRSRLLFVGRFDRHKGGDVVIDAFRKVAHRFPEIRLCFVGPDDGITDDQGRNWTYAKYLHERAPDVAGRVDWLGHQPNSSLADLRRKAFATIVGSRYETFGIVVLEAMAYGCPLAATRAGGIVEIIEDGVNGVLAQPGNADDLASAILRLLEAPEFAAKLGHRAAEDATRYHPDAIAHQTALFHQSVLDRWNASTRHRPGPRAFRIGEKF
jgi:glycosyltransferase involved in cell wall biosynthesis